jgi:hypothetical protein
MKRILLAVVVAAVVAALMAPLAGAKPVGPGPAQEQTNSPAASTEAGRAGSDWVGIALAGVFGVAVVASALVVAASDRRRPAPIARPAPQAAE